MALPDPASGTVDLGHAVGSISDQGILGALLVVAGFAIVGLCWYIKWLWATIQRIQDERVKDAKADSAENARTIASSSATAAALSVAWEGNRAVVQQLVAAIGVLPSAQTAMMESLKRNDDKLDRNGDKMDRLIEVVRGRS